jgi:hypothetical protein
MAETYHFPRTTSGFGSGALAAVIGGTQGDVISVIDFQVTPCTHNFTAPCSLTSATTLAWISLML